MFFFFEGGRCVKRDGFLVNPGEIFMRRSLNWKVRVSFQNLFVHVKLCLLRKSEKLHLWLWHIKCAVANQIGDQTTRLINIVSKQNCITQITTIILPLFFLFWVFEPFGMGHTCGLYSLYRGVACPLPGHTQGIRSKVKVTMVTAAGWCCMLLREWQRMGSSLILRKINTCTKANKLTKAYMMQQWKNK